MGRFRPFAILNSPAAYALFVPAVIVFVLALAAWVLLAMLLSLLTGPGIILVTLALGGLVWFKSHKADVREARINGGFCAACGYDLRASPERCPECGRDPALDEPAWRRMRRERKTNPDGEMNQSAAAMQNRARLLATSPPRAAEILPAIPLEPISPEGE